MKYTIYETEIRRKRRIASPGRIDSPKDAARACADLALLDREHLVRLDLDTRNHLIGRETVHIGTADSAVVSAATILRGAILAGATKIIMVHNHPSGDPSPSEEDRTVTRQVSAAAATVGLPLVDSLIIGHGGLFFSVTGGFGGRVPGCERQRILLQYTGGGYGKTDSA
jgi:DNA repair protein RadC